MIDPIVLAAILAQARKVELEKAVSEEAAKQAAKPKRFRK